MIYTVTFNPAIDYVVRLDAPLEVGEVNRAKGEDCVLGGKGINVSGVLAQLGCESVALGFVAGETGAWLERGLAAQGLKTDFVHLEQGMTRINVKIKAGQETELNGAGPDIPESAMQELEKKLEHLGTCRTRAAALKRVLAENDRVREEILAMVAEYADRFHNQTKEFSPGDRIPYASRVYDKQEMVNLVDSSLEFWLTSGRYTDEFEKKLAEYLHVRYCSLVNSGSSANLVAFMALTSPLLGERRVKRGDEIITVAAGFPTTVTPAIQYGAVPVFVDVTIPQYNIDTQHTEPRYQ